MNSKKGVCMIKYYVQSGRISEEVYSNDCKSAAIDFLSNNLRNDIGQFVIVDIQEINENFGYDSTIFFSTKVLMEHLLPMSETVNMRMVYG